MKRTNIDVEKHIISDYLDGKNIVELSELFSLGTTTIHRILKRNNIKTRGVSEAQRNKNINHGFFNTYNEQSCYWAGFLAADGCLCNKNRSYIISVTISAKDLSHLEKFASSIGYDRKILIKECKTSYGISEYVRLSFASKEMFADLLEKFNIAEKKSLILVPPTIPQHLTVNFIRGYFDGDGYILRGENRAIGFSGTLNVLAWIKKHIKRYVDVGDPNIISDKNIYSLRFTGNIQAPKIVKWLYGHSSNETRLDRKYNIALKYTRRVNLG
jgi:hypothetical protein